MTGFSLQPKPRQSLALAPRQLESLRLLARSIPELRAEIVAEMAKNPVIDEFDHSLEVPLSGEERRHDVEHSEGDYPEDDFVPGQNYDEDALERRQSFFDNQTVEETLQQHLIAQLPLTDIPRTDWDLVSLLVGDLNDNGFYIGSLADAAMAYGRTVSDVEALLAKIRELDPTGCGARNARECLEAQLDSIEDTYLRLQVGRLVAAHLPMLAEGRVEAVRKALGLDSAEMARVLAALRTLDPHPGRRFPGEKDRVEYVNPEIHAVCEQGRWIARTDSRSIPEIHISPRYLAMLKDSTLPEETRAFVNACIQRAQALQEAVIQRQQTVQSIADYIFEHQQDFFSRGMSALKPMTESEIAEKLGIECSTVSRTVRNKYVETPKGTFELRRFFTTGVRTTDGQCVSQEAVLAKLKALVADEDPAEPLSDERLAACLKEAGYPVARRTVAKYRDKLGIPGAKERNK